MIKIPEQYLSSIDDSIWAKINGDRIEEEWIKITTLYFSYAHNREIGITKSGFWITKWNNGSIHLIDSRKQCFNLIVCLQSERQDFYDLIIKSCITKALNPDIVRTFPLIDLIKFALAFSTSWAERALNWLTESDIDEELAIQLQTVIQNKYFSQQLRHKAFTCLKRWERQLPK